MPEFVDHLLDMKERPTALHCGDGIMAFSLLDEFGNRGIRVPDDFAIAGHDGREMSRRVHPYLATIARPRYEYADAR